MHGAHAQVLSAAELSVALRLTGSTRNRIANRSVVVSASGARGSQSLHSNCAFRGCAGSGTRNPLAPSGAGSMASSRSPRLVYTATAPGTTHRPSSRRASSIHSAPSRLLRAVRPDTEYSRSRRGVVSVAGDA